MYKIKTKKNIFRSIDGKTLAENLLLELRAKIIQTKITPGLAVILVGDDKPSKLYVKNKERACQKVGITFHKYVYANETEGQIIEMIKFLNNDPIISGIIVQLPLPRGLNTQKIIDVIDPKKDADGFHPENIKNILSGKSKIYPPLVQTILYIIKNQNIKLKGKKVATISKSEIFSRVLDKALDNEGAKVYSIALEDKNATSILKNTDIIISALGRPKCISGEMIKKDSIFIDVGITKTQNGFCGDADFESIQKVASCATPTPGGTGPVTVAMLLKSTVDLARNKIIDN